MKLINYDSLIVDIGTDIETDPCKRMAQIMTCIVNAPAVEAVPVSAYNRVKQELDAVNRQVRSLMEAAV